MAKQLSAFLIGMAKDEEALARYMKNPRAEARKAGVPDEQNAILAERNPKKIFEYLEGARLHGFFLLIFIPSQLQRGSGRKPAVRTVTTRTRAAKSAKKATPRRRR